MDAVPIDPAGSELGGAYVHVLAPAGDRLELLAAAERGAGRARSARRRPRRRRAGARGAAAADRSRAARARARCRARARDAPRRRSTGIRRERDTDPCALARELDRRAARDDVDGAREPHADEGAQPLRERGRDRLRRRARHALGAPPRRQRRRDRGRLPGDEPRDGGRDRARRSGAVVLPARDGDAPAHGEPARGRPRRHARPAADGAAIVPAAHDPDRAARTPAPATSGASPSLDEDAALFHLVSPAGEWDDEDEYSYESITRIGFGGRYEEALALAAGPDPAV